MRVAVLGAAGYTGGEALRLLLGHPRVEEIIPVSRRFAGQPVASVHRNLLGVTDAKFLDSSVEELDCDVLLAAAPEAEWLERVPELLERGVKVVSLGGKFRVKQREVDEELYPVKLSESAYQLLMEEAVYGLPEVYRQRIRKAKFVANPGCYPTAVILGLYALKGFKLEFSKVSVVAISGTSGAGEAKQPRHAEMSCDLRPYSVSFHRHVPEMEFHLRELLEREGRISFTPMIGDFSRGIMAAIHVPAEEEVDPLPALKEAYRRERFVRVLEEPPTLSAVRGSNFCDLTAVFEKASSCVKVLVAIDNLMKGASGQALQNVNLMMGFKEGEGLELIGSTL